MSRRFCFSCGQLSFGSRECVAFFDGRKCLILQGRLLAAAVFLLIIVVGPAALIGFFPARTFYYFAFCQEDFSCCLGFYGCLLIFKRRHENTQKAAHHQIIDLALLICHMVQLDKLLGGDDRMVIAHLFVIHKGFACFYGLHGKAAGQLPIGSYRTGLQSFFQGPHHIASDVAGIGPRIRQDFVVFIQTLHNVQRLLCG